MAYIAERERDMITPIGAMSINHICERTGDLLVSADDVQEIARKARERAIREFAERIKSSHDAYSWCCADGSMEYCNGDHCESCMDDFKEKIDKIAEQMIADMKKG